MFETNVFRGIKTPQDFAREEQEFELRKRQQAMQQQLGEIQLAQGGVDLQQSQRNLEMGINTKDPSSVREYNFFSNLSPEEQQKFLGMKRAQQTLNLGGTQAVLNPLGGVQQQYEVTPKPEQMPAFMGQQTQAVKDVEQKMNPLIAGETERAKQEATFLQTGSENLIQQKRTIDSMRLQDDFIKAKASEVYSGLDGFLQTGFVGNLGKAVPGTPAYTLQSDIKTLTADSGINSLLEAKAKGATFGALQEKELDLLIALKGSLDQGLPANKIKSNLDQFMAQREKVFNLFEQQYLEDSVRYGSAPSANNAPPADSAPLNQQEIAETIFNAKKAIQAGAPRDAVLQRLIEMGIDPTKEGL